MADTKGDSTNTPLMSQSGVGIHAKIAAVKKEMGAIKKEQVNDFAKWKFRGVDDVLQALTLAMDRVGVHTRTEIENHRVELSVVGNKYRVHATLLMSVWMCDSEDGAQVCIGMGAGEAIDTNGDKASNQAMAAAYKYAVTLGLSIPTDLPDSDHKAPDKDYIPEQEPAIPDPVSWVSEIEAKANAMCILDNASDLLRALYSMTKATDVDENLKNVALAHITRRGKEAKARLEGAV